MNIVEQQHYDVLPSIAAENAANRVKIKQEYDLVCVINSDINKADLYIESLKRDNQRYYELLHIKARELEKLDEELNNLCLSREQIHCNTDNLKKQYELILIDDEQRKKEQDTVCATYEKMIANRQEIFNSNRLVVRRNNLGNRVEAARIQSAVLEGKLKDLEKQKKQLREIQNLNLKAVSIELADVWLTNKKENEKIIKLQNEIKEKEELFNQLSTLKSKPTIINPRSPSSQVASLPIPTPSPPIQIPVLKNMDETELTKYFQKINLFKKDRSPFSLPSVLSRTFSQKLKESILNSPKRGQISIKSPVKKISQQFSNQVDENPEQKDKKDNSPKIIDAPYGAAKTEVSCLPDSSEDIVIDVQSTQSEINPVHDKPNQTPILPNTYPSKPNSPGKMKLTRSVEHRASPLTMSRMSPLSSSPNSPTPGSRIPVPVSNSSPMHVPSRIPVRFTPIKVAQKKTTDNEPAARRPFAKKTEVPEDLDILIDPVDTSKQKKREINSPVRGIKYPKMEYAHMQNANANLQKNCLKDDNNVETPFVMQVDRFKKPTAKGDINVEDIYAEAINENNPIARSHKERIKALREGYAKKDLWDDVKKPHKDAKKQIEERESFETNDARHLSREKYGFAKPYEKFQKIENVRKTDQHNEPKDYRDVEKAKCEMSVKESISRIDKLDEAGKKLQEKNKFMEMDSPFEYEDNYHPEVDYYSELDEKFSHHSTMSNDNRNRSEVFSPPNPGYFVSPSVSCNFSKPLFEPMSEKGSMFNFGSSVNQLFGGPADGANSQNKNQNNGFFDFNFSSSMDQTMDKPFKLF